MAAPSAASSVTTACTQALPGKPTEASTDQFAGGGKSGSSSGDGPLGIALFGAGIIASDAHHRALSALCTENNINNVCVRAVWSRTSAKAEVLARKYGTSKKESCEAYHGTSAIGLVLERSDIDAVVLAVPISELAALSMRVRKAGKHVLSEKPVAHCVAAAREAILCPVPHSGALHAVAENFRFEAGIVTAAVDAARLNPVCISLVAAMHMPPASRFATAWRLAPRHVGAQLLDGGVHFVAALRMAARSDVVSVAASTSTASMHLPPPDSCSAMLSFANGVHATMLISYAASEFVWEMRVIATEGDLCLKRVQGTPAYVLETRLNGKSVRKEFPFSGIEEEFKCFVQCCRNNQIDERIDARTAFNDLATIEAIVKAAESGTTVSVETLEDTKVVEKIVNHKKKSAFRAAAGSSSAADAKRK